MSSLDLDFQISWKILALFVETVNFAKSIYTIRDLILPLKNRVGLFFQKLSDHFLTLPKVEHFDKIENGVFRFGLTLTKKVLKLYKILQNH